MAADSPDMPAKEPRTIVYIDGFNFYYGAVKGTPHKWLDFEALCRRLLPGDNIMKIRYFTARISSQPDDPQRVNRQQTYLRALATLPLVAIHYGRFVTRTVRLPLATPPDSGPRTVEVLRTEEKGSDVNLATYLLLDAFMGHCDTAVVVSNDSDLAEAVRVARSEAGIKVGIINPHPVRHRSARLEGTFFKQLRHGVLAQTQLPHILQDAQGEIGMRRAGKRKGPPKRALHPATEAPGGIWRHSIAPLRQSIKDRPCRSSGKWSLGRSRVAHTHLCQPYRLLLVVDAVPDPA